MLSGKGSRWGFVALVPTSKERVVAMATRYRNVLIDLSGVLYQGHEAITGAQAALKQLRDAGFGVAFLTNTTRQPIAAVVAQLEALGFKVDAAEVLTAPRAARQHIEAAAIGAHLLVHPQLLPELDDLRNEHPQAVLVGDAGEHFTYQSLNAAFRVLMEADDPRLIGMGDNRYFADGTGLSLDMGPFVQALAYATEIEPTIVGKPDPSFFHAAISGLGADPARTIMIGDDVISDIGGAQRAGLSGLLVRTGKYRPGDEERADSRPDHVADDFPAAVSWLLHGAA